MAKRKKHNPEKRAWKGRSYKKGGKRIADLREEIGDKVPETQANPHE